MLNFHDTIAFTLKACKQFDTELEKAMKLLEKNLSDLGFGDEFLHITPRELVL